MSKKILTIVLAMALVLTNAVWVTSVSANDSSLIEHSYSPFDYENFAKTSEEGIWSVYHRPNYSYDMTEWVKLDLSAATDTIIGTEGSRDATNPDAGSKIYFPVFLPDSTFIYQPWYNVEAAKNGGAFGWTAPYTGEWVVKVKAYQRDFSLYPHEGGEVNLILAKQAPSATTVDPFYQQIMAPIDYTDAESTLNMPRMYETEQVVSAAEGETVFLLADGRLDNYVHFQYLISDKNDPTVMYDASKIANYHFTDAEGKPSPFTFGHAKDNGDTLGGTVFLNEYWVDGLSPLTGVGGGTNMRPVDLYSAEGAEWVWAGHPTSFPDAEPVFAMNTSDNYIQVNPRRGNLVSPVIMFTAPEDGNYIFDLAADYTVTDGGNAVFYLYRTGGPRAEGEDWYVVGGHHDEANYRKDYIVPVGYAEPPEDPGFEWKKTLLDMKKGETVMLVPLTYAPSGIVVNLDLSVDKVKDVGYDYAVDGAAVSTFAEVSAAAGKTLSLTCNLLDKETVSSETATMILAVYDGEGRLQATGISEETALTQSNDFVELTASCEIPSGIEGGKVKAFIFDNCKTIRPLVAEDEF